MPTTPGESLPRLPQIVVEDLDVRRRTLAIMRDLCVRPEVRDRIDACGLRERRNQWLRTDGRRGLEIAAHEIATLLAVGNTRAEVTLFPVFLFEVIDELCAEGAGADTLALALEHMRLDAEEDALQGPGLVEAQSGEQLLERAAALRKEAAAGLSLARALEGKARRRTLGLMRRLA